jgi:hypothetical protein
MAAAMSSFGFRPHFSQNLDLSVDEAQTMILRAVKAGEDDCEMKVFPGFICLRIPEEDRHFWSPRLNLSIDEGEDGKTHVTGVYGPNANVWSIFVYGYLLTGSVALFSGILGWVQMTLGDSAWALWIFGAAVAAAIGLYVLAQFGQKLGASQTFRLHQIYESAMGRTEDPH